MKPDLFADTIPEILIADDTIESLRLMSDALAGQGYEVRSVTSGGLALASALAAQPDLILLDIKMPDLSGYEVCQALKANPLTQDIPVIFLSALGETLDKVRAFQVGGVDYITKPFQIEEVLVRVESQLALQLSIKQIQTLNTTLEKRVEERTTLLRLANQSLRQEIVERRQIEQDLRDSEEKFRQISEHIQAVFWLAELTPENPESIAVRYVSPAFETIWGKPRQAIYHNPWEWLAAIHPDDRQRVDTAHQRHVVEGKYDEEYRIIRPDGTLRWIRDRGYPIYDANGVIYRIAGIAEDITARIQAELERDRFFNLSLDLLFIANRQGSFKRLNPAWYGLLGYTEQQLIGLSFLELVHPEDRAIAEEAIHRLTQGQDINELEIRCRRQGGDYLWMAWNAVPFLQEELIYGAGRNISQRKESEERLVYETLHDALTGLANRPCFMERLSLAVGRCPRQQVYNFAVLFIDLDGFKGINDTLGHGVGDQLLIRVSQLLQESVRTLDAVARLGGDEFTILLEDIQSLKEVIEVAERIQTLLKPAITIEHHEIFTSASIGIVMGNSQYQQVADIVRDADIAMYRAKANGKACYEVFDRTMYAETLHLVELENHLRHAILRQELQVYYQPIVSLQNPPILQGFEVLLRWNHRQKGLIPAYEFIPIAEEAGLIDAIGEWTLQQACIQFSHWQHLWGKFDQLYLSVNISGRQLRNPSLLKTLDRILAKTQIPAQCLRLEITESSLIQNTQIATQLLQNIQQRGIRISL